MKKLVFVLFIVVMSVAVVSCGDAGHEQVGGYIPKGAEVSIIFKDDTQIPICEIPVVVKKDTVMAQAMASSMFPGRFLVFFHHKHPLANTDSISVIMSKDKQNGTFKIYRAMIKQK